MMTYGHFLHILLNSNKPSCISTKIAAHPLLIIENTVTFIWQYSDKKVTDQTHMQNPKLTVENTAALNMLSWSEIDQIISCSDSLSRLKALKGLEAQLIIVNAYYVFYSIK